MSIPEENRNNFNHTSRFSAMSSDAVIFSNMQQQKLHNEVEK